VMQLSLEVEQLKADVRHHLVVVTLWDQYLEDQRNTKLEMRF
jgi:hypothetical protein